MEGGERGREGGNSFGATHMGSVHFTLCASHPIPSVRPGLLMCV